MPDETVICGIMTGLLPVKSCTFVVLRHINMNLTKDTYLQGGKYKIIRQLGQGGFGVTYLAIQTALDRKVAVKEFFINNLLILFQ